MDKKILLLSLFAASLLVLLPLSSVIGTKTITTESNQKISPLFTTRVNTFLQKDTKHITSYYLGKGNALNFFITEKQTLDTWIDKAIKLVQMKPELFDHIIDKIDSYPNIVNVLQQYHIDVDEAKHYITLVKNHPALLDEEIKNSAHVINDYYQPPLDDPEPLGFSGQPGCLIGFLIVFPIILMIAMMVATFTIITCLNIGGCFEKIMENLAEGMQGLTPP
jgi:hypothetical protein